MAKGKYEKQIQKMFLYIGVILVSSAVMISSVVFTDKLQQQYYATIDDIMSSNKLYSEISATNIYTAMTEIGKNTDINNWNSATTRSDYYYQSIQVKDTLNHLQQSFPNTILYPAVTQLGDEHFVISSSGTATKQEYFSTETNLSAEQTTYLLDYFDSNFGTLILPVYEESHTLSDLYYLFNPPYFKTNMLYMIRIPESSLFTTDSHNHFFIYDDNGIIAYSDNSEETTSLLSQLYEFSISKEATKPDSIDTVYYNNHIIRTLTLDNLKLKIAFIYQDIGFDIIKMLLYIALPALLACFILYWIMRQLSNWLYRPIKEILPDVLSTNEEEKLDEFHLLKEQAITARTLATNLQDALQENSTLLQQRFYRDLILGLNVFKNDLYKDVPKIDTHYSVALFDFPENNNASLDDDIFFMKNALITHTQEQASIFAVNNGDKQCALIITADTNALVLEEIRHLQSKLPDQWDYRIALSNIRYGFKQIRTSYVEASRVLEYKYLYNTSNILTAKQISEDTLHDYHYPISLENRLIQAILEGRSSAITIFDDLVRDNFKNQTLSFESVRGFMYALLSSISRLFQELKSTPIELLGHDIDYEYHYTNWNHPSTISFIKNTFIEILDAIQERNKNSSTNTIEAMKQYIYDNYSRDITLEDMAESLNISTKYSSNLFKKLNNDTFKNFLNHYRIEKAKEFIRENPSIKVVSLFPLVGFNSANTFIRVFGKYTGMTPGTYATVISQEQKN